MITAFRFLFYVSIVFWLGDFIGAAQALEERPVLSLEMAKKMADACEAMAKKEGWKVNIAIFDSGGNLKLFLRQDDAYLGSVDIAQMKGRSSVLLPFPTRYLGDNVAYKDPKRPHGIELIPGIVVFPGGLPVQTRSGQLIGGIGVSGATSDQDEQCAQSGIDTIHDMLVDN
jgi:glc operon protein GlcG